MLKKNKRIKKIISHTLLSAAMLSGALALPVSAFAEESGSSAHDTAVQVQQETNDEQGYDARVTDILSDGVDPDLTDPETTETENEADTENSGQDPDDQLPDDKNADLQEDGEDKTSGVGSTLEDPEKKGDKDDKKDEDENKNGWIKEDGKEYYYKDNNKHTGWVFENGNYIYVKVGEKYTGWHYMSNAEGETTPHWSYFDKTGAIYTGWHYMSSMEGEKQGHWSYFGTNGWLRTGWVQLGKGTSNPDGNKQTHWSYFGSNGWLRTGWVRLGKGTAEPDNNTTPHWSYFGSNGWLRTGWVKLGKGTVEPDNNSTPHWSYFGNNGWLTTEWKYFTEKDGETTPHWSFFGDNGWLRTGWYTNYQGLHWFDGNGWLATGNPVVEGKLYNDTNNNGVLKENGSYNGWHFYNDKYYHILNGKVNTNMKRVTSNIDGKWYEIENGVSIGLSQGKALLAHASGDERGQYYNGVAGDQTSSEVCFRSWYARKDPDDGRYTPWQYVIRAKSEDVRKKIAYAMERAVYNDKIGYDMNGRNSLYALASKVGYDPGKVTAACECDCSSLVSVACMYAGISSNYTRIGNNAFSTSTMRSKLAASGKFDIFSSKDYTESSDKLIVGDILVIEYGHTAVVVRTAAEMK